MQHAFTLSHADACQVRPSQDCVRLSKDLVVGWGARDEVYSLKQATSKVIHPNPSFAAVRKYDASWSVIVEVFTEATMFGVVRNVMKFSCVPARNRRAHVQLSVEPQWGLH